MSRLLAVLRVVGDLLITAAVIIFLFVGYELWFTNVLEARSQHALRSSLQRTWAQQSTSGPTRSTAEPATPAATPARFHVPALGQPFALLVIPRLHVSDVVVEGTGHDQLKLGPGHYSGSALPGQIGNMVISGHRTTYGAPFRNLDALSTGDPILIETATTTYTYRLMETRIVTPDDIGVLLPVPEKAGAVPSAALLTLTTCHPPFSASHRMVLVSRLTGTAPRTAGSDAKDGARQAAAGTGG